MARPPVATRWRACRWFYEQQHDHPVVGIPAGADYKTWEEYFAYRRERWMPLLPRRARGDVLNRHGEARCSSTRFSLRSTRRRRRGYRGVLCGVWPISSVRWRRASSIWPPLILIRPIARSRAARGALVDRDPASGLRNGRSWRVSSRARGLHGFDGLLATGASTMPSASAQSRPWSCRRSSSIPAMAIGLGVGRPSRAFLGLTLVAEPSLAPGELGGGWAAIQTCSRETLHSPSAVRPPTAQALRC